MANGRRSAEWEHTSSILAILANCHRDSKERQKPYTPAEFNPTLDAGQVQKAKAAANKPIPAQVSALKALLPKAPKPCQTSAQDPPTSS